MAYSEDIAKKVEEILLPEKGITQKKMFGGLCFLLNGNMLLAVKQDSLLVRVDQKDGEELSQKPGVKPMAHNGRVMNGFLFVDESEYQTDQDLASWIFKSLDFVKTLPARKN